MFRRKSMIYFEEQKLLDTKQKVRKRLLYYYIKDLINNGSEKSGILSLDYYFDHQNSFCVFKDFGSLFMSKPMNRIFNVTGIEKISLSVEK